ncbi:sensor histidine kinase [Puia dinghuensis]|uniref:histidine kinase n=1 Tax=Puia dinghuensis TaxID=1792502 RepID=A0A8J2UI69_9BACT|nr:ATP-binding protein [Puia dinghuensis]GGB20984.1 two-component sensor histidine kinase [Puia dinghuensis]
MKIRIRLALLFTALVAALLLVFSLAIYVSNARDREAQYYERLRQQAITKADLLLDAKVQPSVLQLIYKNSLNALPQEEVAIYDTVFHLLYHDAVYIDRVKETRGMIDSIVRLKEIHFYTNDLQAIGFLYRYGGKDYVITAAAKDIDGLAKLRDLRIALIVGFIAAIVLTLVAGALFSRQALQPVTQMVDKVEEITASNLDLRIQIGKRKDEIAELAITFNRMLDRLESSFDAQKQFVSNISHELRTPLAAIIGELEIAAAKERTNTQYQEMTLLVLEDARRLARLSNDLLDLAKASYDQTEIAFKKMRVDELLLETRQEAVKANPDYRITILFEREPDTDDLISVNGNSYLLKVAFTNLMENGCKFSADHQVTVAISFHGKNIILRFSDTGIGIPPEDIENIFTPFYRGANKNYTEGNGIGLSLTDKIIRLHHGSLTVSSRVGEGTTFTVELPHL